MARWVVAAILLLPVAELAALLQLGATIGPGRTLLYLLGAMVLGVQVVRIGAGRARRQLEQRIAQGVTPSREIADGTLTLVAGVLLIVPGPVTDVLALLLLLPFTRPLVRRPVERGLGGFVVLRGPGGRGATVRGEVLRGEVLDPEARSGPDEPGRRHDEGPDGLPPGPS